jgi:hypothetical protein
MNILDQKNKCPSDGPQETNSLNDLEEISVTYRDCVLK